MRRQVSKMAGGKMAGGKMHGKAPRGVRPKIQNPGKIFKRLMSYVFRNYGGQFILVVILIFVGVLANVQ